MPEKFQVWGIPGWENSARRRIDFFQVLVHDKNGGRMMSTQHAPDEADIRQVIDKLLGAIRAMDVEGLEACFTADMVSFDLEPPLQHVGVEAKLKNWREAFKVFHPPLGYEIRDLTITVGEDVAFAYGINRLSGSLNGNQFGPWVRWTAGFRKVDGKWLIAHDQVSVPVDFPSGRAMLDLEPDGLTT
jgi:ketosteroid isomerase-like protein